MIDLHCHLLPGIDDGPEDMETSLSLAKIAVADGITHAVVTPHIHPGRWENSASSINKSVQVFRKHLENQGILLKLGYAAEIRITDRLFEQLKNKQLPFLGEMEGEKYLLLEFPHGHLIPGAEKLIHWLVSEGIRPVIAHPERNRQVMQNRASIEPLLKGGCCLQVTAGSLVGRFGDAAKHVAEQLLLEDKIFFLATDAHNLKARQPLMSEARTRVCELIDDKTAHRLVYETPWRLAANQFD